MTEKPSIVETISNSSKRTKARVVLDFSLAVAFAVAFLAIPAFLINHFYQALNDPDPRDALPEVEAEFSAIIANLENPRGSLFTITKSSHVSLGHSFAAPDGNQFLKAARAAALRNHYVEPSPNANAGAQSGTSMILCSERSIHRRFEVSLRDERAYVQIYVTGRPQKMCSPISVHQ